MGEIVVPNAILLKLFVALGIRGWKIGADACVLVSLGGPWIYHARDGGC
jgi:hypothetical protein